MVDSEDQKPKSIPHRWVQDLEFKVEFADSFLRPTDDSRHQWIDKNLRETALYAGPKVEETRPPRWYKRILWGCFVERQPTPEWKQQVDELCEALKLLSAKEWVYMEILLAEHGYGYTKLDSPMNTRLNCPQSQFKIKSEKERNYVRSLIAEITSEKDSVDDGTQATEKEEE